MKKTMIWGMAGLFYIFPGCFSESVEEKPLKSKAFETKTLELEVEKHDEISLKGRSAANSPLDLVTESMKEYKKYFYIEDSDNKKYTIGDIDSLVFDPAKRYFLMDMRKELWDEKGIDHMTMFDVPERYEHKSMPFVFLYDKKDLDENDFMAEVYKIFVVFNLKAAEMADKKNNLDGSVNSYALTIKPTWFDKRPEGYGDRDLIFVDAHAYFFYEDDGSKLVKNKEKLGNFEKLILAKNE